MSGKPFYLGKPMALVKGLQNGELSHCSIENRAVLNTQKPYTLENKTPNYAGSLVCTSMCPSIVSRAVSQEFGAQPLVAGT